MTYVDTFQPRCDELAQEFTSSMLTKTRTFQELGDELSKTMAVLVQEVRLDQIDRDVTVVLRRRPFIVMNLPEKIVQEIRSQ